MNISRIIILLLLVVSGAISSMGYTLTVDGFDYELSTYGDEATLKKYPAYKYYKLPGDFEVPATITTYNGRVYRVTAIANEAFEGCTIFNTVTLPPHLKTIGKKAFAECTNLTLINIPGSVTEIEDKAFSGCVSLKELTIEDSDEWINILMDVFEGVNLEKLYLGRGIEPIATNVHFVFENMTNLKELTIGPDVVTIKYNLFKGATGLESVTFPESVKYINSGAFEGCVGLRKVEFPSNLQSISDKAFRGCKNIESVVLPSRLQEIGDYAFEGCELPTSLIIPKKVVYMGEGAFKGWTALRELILEDSRTPLVVYKQIFTDTGIKSLYLGREIEDKSYSKGSNPLGDSGITELTIGPEVETFGIWFETDELSKLTIPATVLKIDAPYTYSKFDNLEEIVFEYSDTFLACDENLFLCFPAKRVYLGRRFNEGDCNPFDWSKELSVEELVVDGRLERTGTYSCRSLKKAVLQEGIEILEDQCFSHCYKLAEVEFPQSLKEIGFYCFTNNRSLERIDIPDGVEIIGEYAFLNCEALKSVMLPTQLKDIEKGVFAGRNALEEIYYGSVDPVEGSTDIFEEEIYKNATLFVPEEFVEKYRGIEPWRNFKNIQGHLFAGVEDVDAEESNEDISVYTLTGQYVGNNKDSLGKGVYIIKKGNKVEKILVH